MDFALAPASIFKYFEKSRFDYASLYEGSWTELGQ